MGNERILITSSVPLYSDGLRAGRPPVRFPEAQTYSKTHTAACQYGKREGALFQGTQRQGRAKVKNGGATPSLPHTHEAQGLLHLDRYSPQSMYFLSTNCNRLNFGSDESEGHIGRICVSVGPLCTTWGVRTACGGRSRAVSPVRTDIAKMTSLRVCFQDVRRPNGKRFDTGLAHRRATGLHIQRIREGTAAVNETSLEILKDPRA